MNVNSDDRLKVNVNRFENSNVWNAENRHRLVVPKPTVSLAVWREFYFNNPFIQPPIILPISSNCFESIMYLLLSMFFNSQLICRKNLSRSSLPPAFWRYGSFCSFPKKLAMNRSSIFDKTFIADSYSCRINKGTHKAVNRFRFLTYKASKNNTKTCWILKCDIKKFFANIDHKVLLDILDSYIPDKQIIWLLREIIESFSSKPGIGLPLGNLTSQLLVNIYMNEFDQFVKHKLKIKYYIRYADDFVILSNNKKELENLIFPINKFLFEKLKLQLHPDKVFIKTLASGVDFLGWVNFPDHRILRNTTKRRMLRRIIESPTPETLNSYLGLLKHGNARKLQKEVCERMFIL